MTLSRLRGGRPRKPSADRRQAAAEASELDRKRQQRVERQQREQQQQDQEADEYDALYEEAWTLTDRADNLGMRLCAAYNTSPELFEDVRQEIEDWLADDPRSQNEFVYLGHLEGWLGLFGLDPATAKPLFAA